MRIASRHLRWLLPGAIVLLLSVVLSGWSTYELRRAPWTGMQFNRSEQADQALPGMIGRIPAFGPGSVTNVYVGSPAHRAGLRISDRILRVNDVPSHDMERLRELRKQLRIGDTLVFRVERGRNSFDAHVTLEAPLRAPSFVLSLATGFLLALVFGAFGLWVACQRPESRHARLFFLLSILLATSYLSVASLTSALLTGVGVIDTEGPAPWFWIPLGLAVISASLVPPLLLHFSLVFPREAPWLSRRPGPVLVWLYALPLSYLLLIPVALLSGLLGSIVPDHWNGPLLRALGFGTIVMLLFVRLLSAARRRGASRALLDRPWSGLGVLILGLYLIVSLIEIVTRAYEVEGPTEDLLVLGIIGAYVLFVLGVTFVVYPAATCVLLYRSYRSAGVEERAQLRWPLWGTIVAVSGVAVLVVVGTTLSFTASGAPGLWNVASDLLGKLFYLLIPFSFSFAILKYRLMDIELVLRKTLVYSMLTGSILLAYLVLAGGLGGLVVRFGQVESESVIIAATLVIALALVPVRNRIQTFVDRRFFRARYDHPEALAALSEGLRQASDPVEISRLIADQVQRALRTRTVVVFVRPGSEGVLRALATVGLPDEALRRLLLPGDGPLTGGSTSLDVARTEWDDGTRRTLRRARSALLCPILRGKELLGALSIGGKLSGEPLDEDDRDFCGRVAELAGMTFDNLRLRKRGEEVDRALEIQRHLLPEHLPTIPGYELSASWLPSATVAGDYYDALDLGDGKVGLCIADATGKGIPAALLMSNVQAAFRALARGAGGPAELARRLNQILSASVANNAFISFFYAELEPKSGRLRYVNAGHNAPLRIARDGTVNRLTEGGLILGAFPEREYAEDEIRLRDEDRLILYTDGITEVRDAHGEEFGEQRLIELAKRHRRLGALELQQKIRRDVDAFGPGELLDDATLLVLAADRNQGRSRSD